MLNLRDGEERLIEDKWVSGQIIPDDGVDTYLTYGRTAITSYFRGKAKREGDQILISGTVSHQFDDIYDFHEHQPYASAPLTMLKHGAAKTFATSGKTLEAVEGTVRVDRGRTGTVLSDPSMTWRDITLHQK